MPSTYPRLSTLAQWSPAGPWQAELPHSCPHHALIWITRGQGRALIGGVRRGVGVHNALVIPAGTLFALDVGRQGFGLVCEIPPGGAALMPDEPQHLRLRDVQAQAELTAILDAMQREQNTARPFLDEAMTAHAALLSVWLRRTMIDHSDDRPAHPTAAQRLVTAYAALIERDYRTGKPMADYARALGVTPTHLTRTCQGCAGLGASKLLTQRSLHEARVLLETGDRPFKQIAAMLGFRSAAYFSRFVQHHTGLTPTALRRKAQTQPTPAQPGVVSRAGIAPGPSRHMG